MAVNARSKLAAEVTDIPIKNIDGSPMLQEDGTTPVTATVFGPASKIWQVADATKRRKAMKRVREANNKLEAAADDGEDVIDFLCAVTKRFNGLELDGEPDQVRAIYSEPGLGYIRDQMEAAATNWENFTRPSPTPAASSPGSSPG